MMLSSLSQKMFVWNAQVSKNLISLTKLNTPDYFIKYKGSPEENNIYFF